MICKNGEYSKFHSAFWVRIILQNSLIQPFDLNYITKSATWEFFLDHAISINVIEYEL
jgi:hypothetical protein